MAGKDEKALAPLFAPRGDRRKYEGVSPLVASMKESARVPAELTKSPYLPGRSNHSLKENYDPNAVALKPALDVGWMSSLLGGNDAIVPPAPAVTAPAVTPPAPVMRDGQQDSYAMMGLPQGPVSPVVVDNGKVRPNPRYGMPDRPDIQRRELAERLGDVTGGAVPTTMEGFMVANFLQNQLRVDDSRNAADAKDLYKSDLSALPQFMSEDRLRQMMPYEQEARSAQAESARATASGQPSLNRSRDAQATLALKQAETLLTNEQEMLKASDNQLTVLAKDMAKEMLTMQGGDASDPLAVADQAAAILAQLMHRRDQMKKGVLPKMGEPTPDTAWFSDNSKPAALEWPQ